MLGKLLKHEWKAVWKIPTILIGILLILAVLSGLPFIFPLWHSDIEGLDILVMVMWMVFYFALLSVGLGITVYLAIHFYKSMFTDEGYLTHTLPVTTHQLLISKILPMIAWSFLCIVGILASIMIFAGMAVVFLKPDNISFREVIIRVIEVLEDEKILQTGYVELMLSVVFLSIMGIINGVMTVVGSVSIGQLVNKHKVLGSIGAYFAINTVMQMCTGMVVLPVMFENFNRTFNIFRFLSNSYWIMGIIALFTSVGLYFLSVWLIRDKLNLD